MAESRYVLNTASGAQLDLEAPDPATISLADIASALSKICRFGAQAGTFYSVAQHAVLVQRFVIQAGRPDLALVALHHDSHEAFAGDIPTPLKRMIRSETAVYSRVCDRIDVAIAQALGFKSPGPGSPEQRVIKGADERALWIEGAALLADGTGAIPDSPPPETLDEPLLPDRAERLFLETHTAHTSGPS